MKYLAVAMVCIALALSGTARAAEAPAPKGEPASKGEPAPKGEKERLGYSLGMDVGSTLRGQSIEVDPDAMARGFKDAYTGRKTLLTEDEARTEIMEFQKKLLEKQAGAMKQLAEKNRQEGEKFLAENAKKEGVKTLPSGLQYKVLKDGTGKIPKATDTVTTHYRGTLIDGTEFDSSYKRNEPATFPVSGVIPGWTEALQLMKEGAKWQIFLPPSLAYGERGVGRDIGPNATLIFDVELLSVQ